MSAMDSRAKEEARMMLAEWMAVPLQERGRGEEMATSSHLDVSYTKCPGLVQGMDRVIRCSEEKSGPKM